VSSTDPTVLCAGIAVQDVIFRVERFPTPANKVSAQEVVVTGGGCAANAAIAVARLGARARYAGPLGDDAVSDAILSGLWAENVDTTGVVRKAGARAPVSGIFVDGEGERLIATRRDASLADVRSQDPVALVADIDILLIDNRLPDFVRPVAEAARRRGVPVVLDADKPAQQDDPLFVLASHTIFGADALRDTVKCGELAEALVLAGSFCTGFAAVTDGANGVLRLDQGRARLRSAFRVTALDTLAAGDVFHGAFALALAEGSDLDAALTFGCAAAALKCTRFGGIAGAPRRDAVSQLLAQEALK
jgi:sulfofructose kinase